MAERPKLSLLRTDRRILITQEGGQFRVCVDPAPDGPDLTAIFPTYRAARGNAGGLRLVHRWSIIDQTCPGEGMSK
ncbi:hypothetical protein FHS51_000776 [Sphingobium wenxiniae]|uniref:Uncharacterized protein n=1 Tax=Sphingobium wenxiniae (strain DSM 21828 / CGMCC 1.7748 / JZ-1) TaxID=595605 RepID=A0A562KIR6_SPHWJ|nr:hypothetical protein [Sphingobium wenxiniae]MBB6190563.1 hypothetical protein [Sphingobium wenxiniae]TWH95277.1 hypothetical protein IQ35_01533 [Sphingobium wenxiniae]